MEVKRGLEDNEESEDHMHLWRKCVITCLCGCVMRPFPMNNFNRDLFLMFSLVSCSCE